MVGTGCWCSPCSRLAAVHPERLSGSSEQHQEICKFNLCIYRAVLFPGNVTQGIKLGLPGLGRGAGISGVCSVPGDAPGRSTAWGAGSSRDTLGAPCEQELPCSALLPAESALNRCDVTGGTCFGGLSWLLSDVRRMTSPSPGRGAVGSDTSHSGESGSWEPAPERTPLPRGRGTLWGRIQMLLLRRQEGAPRSVECTAEKELKGIPAVKASSD